MSGIGLLYLAQLPSAAHSLTHFLSIGRGRGNRAINVKEKVPVPMMKAECICKKKNERFVFFRKDVSGHASLQRSWMKANLLTRLPPSSFHEPQKAFSMPSNNMKPRPCAKPSHPSGPSANSTLLQTPAKWRQDGHAQYRTSRRQRQGCDESDSRPAAATVQRARKKKKVRKKPAKNSVNKFVVAQVHQMFHNHLDKNFEQQLCK